jgi:hypothetical protein
MADAQLRTPDMPGYDASTDPDASNYDGGTTANWFAVNQPPATAKPKPPAPVLAPGASHHPPPAGTPPPAAPPAAAAPTPTGPPHGGSLTDRNYVASLVQYYGSQPGADPSLSSNPQYWIDKIMSGELGGDEGYVIDKMQNAWKTPASAAGAPGLPSSPSDALSKLPSPVLNLPLFKQAPAFTPTAMSDVLADPGYEFRVDQGESLVEQSAAARGTLNSGGTLKDILNYGQNAASQEFQNVDARRRSDYQTNYQTQYVDPYQAAYQAAKDSFSLPNDQALRAFGAWWDPALRLAGTA